MKSRWFRCSRIVAAGLFCFGFAALYWALESLDQSGQQAGEGGAQLALKNGLSLPLLNNPSQAHWQWQTSQGQQVVLNFWASWCLPCLGEKPYIEELIKNYGERVEVVMVSLDGELSAAEGAAGSKPLQAKVVWDDVMLFPREFALGQIPQTWLVGKDGRIVLKIEGPLNTERLGSLIQHLETSNGDV